MLNEYAVLNHLRDLSRARPELLSLHNKVLDHLVSAEMAMQSLMDRDDLTEEERKYLREDAEL